MSGIFPEFQTKFIHQQTQNPKKSKPFYQGNVEFKDTEY